MSPTAATTVAAAGATEALFREHGAAVLRWARALGGPRLEADEVVQEVFLIAHQGLGRFRGESSATTWLFGITANVVRGLRRRARHRRWLRGSADETAGELPATTAAAPEVIAQQEARERVYAVLNRMSEKYRTVLILFELEERPAAEIAELMGAKVGTVCVWLHRARADFLKRLSQEAGDP